MNRPDPHADQPVRMAGAPLDRANGAVVVLHGRGASAASILTLADEFAQPDLAYIAPQAAGSTWYPYSFLAPLDRNEPGLSSALATVGRVLGEIADGGVPLDKTVLLGFSQGACLALEYAARNAGRYGGVVALSGGLIGNEQLVAVDPPADKVFAYDGDLEGTPVFLGCSDEDAHIPLDRVQHSTQALRDLGGDVTERIYPGMGHTVNDDEIRFVRGLLARLQAEG